MVCLISGREKWEVKVKGVVEQTRIMAISEGEGICPLIEHCRVWL
jgi:hypothetical protein